VPRQESVSENELAHPPTIHLVRDPLDHGRIVESRR
jgi:hypothetical protein